jgi:uncharacterized protein with HEPN domain
VRSDLERFMDMLEAIQRIEKHTIGGRPAFEMDELLQVWVVRHLQIIGEAASKVSEPAQQRFNEIPWGKMIGMRHILVHGYFEIDLEIVWSVLQNDLEPLKFQIERALKEIK